MKRFSSHFGLRHWIVAFISTRFFGGVTYTVKSGPASGMRRKGGLGFLPVRSPETAETKFLSALDLAGKTVYDIGGFEGILTLFFAKRAAQVFTYEPNRRNYRRCLDNIELNHLKNVTVFNRGVSSAPGVLTMTYDPLMPGAASANEEVRRQIMETGGKTVSISVNTLDADFENEKLPPPDFIKLDIEGMEAEALRGMKQIIARHSPDLYIELHGAEFPDKIRIATAVVDFLIERGYRVYDVENAAYLSSVAKDVLPPSHVYCTTAEKIKQA